MSHPYAKERVARAAYVEQTRLQLHDTLARREVQTGLGNTAMRLLNYADGLYIPDVSDEGVVTIPSDRLQTDRIPILALRDDEQVQRDATFASFSPEQYRQPDVKPGILNTVAARMAAQSEDYDAQTHNEDARIIRLTYNIPNYPSQGEYTYFNMRPLMMLRYESDTKGIAPTVTAAALMQAHLLTQSPVCVVPNEAGFDAFNNRINEQTYQLGVFLGGFISKGWA